MEQNLIPQSGSLQTVIDTVKDLIADVEMKIKKDAKNNSASS